MRQFSFLRYAFLGGPLALLVLAVSLGALAFRHWEYAPDFTDGAFIKAEFPSLPPSERRLREAFKKLSGARLVAQRVADENILLLRIGAAKNQNDRDKAQRYCNVLTAAFPDARCLAYGNLGSGIGKKTVDRGMTAAFLAAFSVATYVWLRFGWPYALATAVVLLCQATSCAGFFALTGLDISTTSLSGALAGAMYAVIECVALCNGTRDCMRRHKNATFGEALNKSVGATAKRATLTLFTTALALATSAAFGGPALAGPSVATLFAAIAGTFFTFFVGTPILDFLHNPLRRSGY
ncbi:MAG: hypothetical protein ABW189_02990 [Rickettsiales bacterium]